jgi:endonuclease/exonuclease/phosphatase family metal-dependent hydrolase
MLQDYGMPALRVTSYNLLADCYASARLFPSIDADMLGWQSRGERVVERVVAIAPDIACLQEVEATAWPALKASLERAGYLGVFSGKRQRRPDGCALVYRATVARLTDWEPIYFEDALGDEPASGHLALAGRFETELGSLHIVGTHLRWQAPATEEECESHIGYRQARQLLAWCAEKARFEPNIVVCGDFNAGADSALVRLFSAAGYRDAYASAPQATCNPNRRAVRIDFVFASPGLGAMPESLRQIDGETSLPSADEPSDHLPITATLACQENSALRS